MLRRASNNFIKVEELFITTINYVGKVFYSSLFNHCLSNGIVGKQTPYCLKYLLIYKYRISLPILINMFIILLC
jgi:hypothetical protein